VAAALDRKAEDLEVLELKDLSSITDHFVICHGNSTRQVQAISDHIEEKLREIRVRPGHVEGYAGGEWILMDYVDLVVHIFTRDKRRFYRLEKLWSDAPRLDLDGKAAG
jgi:ribosome-associated protein